MMWKWYFPSFYVQQNRRLIWWAVSFTQFLIRAIALACLTRCSPVRSVRFRSYGQKQFPTRIMKPKRIPFLPWFSPLASLVSLASALSSAVLPRVAHTKSDLTVDELVSGKPSARSHVAWGTRGEQNRWWEPVDRLVLARFRCIRGCVRLDLVSCASWILRLLLVGVLRQVLVSASIRRIWASHVSDLDDFAFSCDARSFFLRWRYIPHPRLG
jgi:hypothetical protein